MRKVQWLVLLAMHTLLAGTLLAGVDRVELRVEGMT